MLFRSAGVKGAGANINSTPVSNVPGAPTNLTVRTGLASGQAYLNWTAPASAGSSPITDYRVEYRVTGANNWSSFAHTASTRSSITVTGLKDGSTFEFQVSAVNASGAGLPTSPILSALVSAPTTIAPLPPSSFTATAEIGRAHV